MTKKQIHITIIVAALAIVASMGIFHKSDEEKYGIDSIDKEDTIWVKCSNPNCGHFYEMNKREYYRLVDKNMSRENMAGLLDCEKCRQKTICRAEKCEKCGEVFLWGLSSWDYADRCSKCGYSKTQALQPPK